MPLTEPQIENITSTITSVNTQVNIIVNSREDLLALVRIHADVTDTDATSVIVSSRLRAKDAAVALVTLLS